MTNQSKEKNIADQAAYFDKVVLSEEFDFSKAIRVPAKIKRVTMNIPFLLYKEAFQIGEETGIGYQNSLKTAIAIGLKHLKKEVLHGKKLVRIPTQSQSSRLVAEKQ